MTMTEIDFTDDERPYAVYRLYDADDRLLYVGMTSDSERRMQAHASGKVWWNQVAHQVIEWHPGKADALTAEAAAIRTEFPRYNVVHAITPESLTARQLLAEWKARVKMHEAERDSLIRAARESGLNILRISHLSGLSRTTIYAILGDARSTP
jgi:predicted GIY-YIG superfamily endonuclease